MTIRATTNARQAYNQIKDNLRELRQQANEWQNQLSVDVGAFNVVQMCQSLSAIRTRMVRVESTPGLAEYARTAENDLTYNVVTEWNGLKGLIDAAIAQIITDFPTSPRGRMEAASFNADGSVAQDIFPAASPGVVRIRTAILAVRDFIEVT